MGQEIYSGKDWSKKQIKRGVRRGITEISGINTGLHRGWMRGIGGFGRGLERAGRFLQGVAKPHEVDQRRKRRMQQSGLREA